jgi:hypothetical protein
MKYVHFMLISVFLCAFLSVGCGQNETSDLNKEKAVSENSTPNENFTETDNLLEKYKLSMRSDWFIWNDYMPGGLSYSERSSICTISFDSITELPPMEVFATIITERITIPVLLYDIYNGSGTYGTLFRKDFRPVNDFRLNDGEEYTIKINIRILGEQQTITFEKLKVYTTW